MIKAAEVTKILQINLYCDKCGKRMEKLSYLTLASHPPKFTYKCECGEVQTSTRVYPFQQIFFDEENAKEIDLEEVKRDE